MRVTAAPATGNVALLLVAAGLRQVEPKEAMKVQARPGRLNILASTQTRRKHAANYVRKVILESGTICRPLRYCFRASMWQEQETQAPEGNAGGKFKRPGSRPLWPAEAE